MFSGWRLPQFEICPRGSFAILCEDGSSRVFWQRFNIQRHAPQLFHTSYHRHGYFFFVTCPSPLNPLNRLVASACMQERTLCRRMSTLLLSCAWHIRDGADSHTMDPGTSLLGTFVTAAAPFFQMGELLSGHFPFEAPFPSSLFLFGDRDPG